MPPNDFSAARLAMVESQLRTNKVTHAGLLAGFLEIPRERFVPANLRGAAYVDEDLPLKPGRFLMEPMVLARLLQLAEVTPDSRVLELGAATGYVTAILSRLAKSVVAVEADKTLSALAAPLLHELRCGNVTWVTGSPEQGHESKAPYDIILIDGAVSFIPDAVAAQLAEGGRLATIWREPGEPMGLAMLMTRIGSTLSRRPAFDAATPPLPGFAAAAAFVF
jgi:protein-L-isoaspartate(D-aspartate) O-methyltransferase